MRRNREPPFGRTDLPPKQRDALRKAVRWEIFTLCYTAITIVLVAFVVGNSQAMKTAWIEDMLSALPQVAFLVAVLVVRRRPTRERPYGLHRSMGIGHLVAGVALLAVGTNLALDAVTGLINAEHPTIGTVVVFGSTIWLGWLMISVMGVIVIGPVALYGPAKAKLAPVIHNKLLYADADMAKADWQTNAASIVGVLGVGLGIWWLDGAAALFISVGIVSDGWKNTRSAVSDLMDRRARTYDDKEPHPLIAEVTDLLRSLSWVANAAVRVRDLGQVFHVEAFVVLAENAVTPQQLREASEAVASIDWKVQDIVIAVADRLPREADPGKP